MFNCNIPTQVFSWASGHFEDIDLGLLYNVEPNNFLKF